MSRLDDLPPDQRATLSLLLRTRKSYAEVAGLLGISEQAVHDRAHAALAVLAAPQARELSADERERIGDYLLGQGGKVGHAAARADLSGSGPARAWADAIVDELSSIEGAELPEIPEQRTVGVEPGAPPRGDRPTFGSTTPAFAPASGSKRTLQAPPVSRLGGALVLAGIAALVVVVVLLANSGSSSSTSSSSTSSGASSTSAASTGSTSSSNSSAAKAKEDRRITLAPTDPSSKAVGIAEVLSEGSQYAFYLAAEHLAPSKGFFYAVWLYNSPTSFEALSRAPNVGSNGNLQGGALLPKDAGKYHTMLLTRETKSSPTSPGPVVLRGAFALH